MFVAKIRSAVPVSFYGVSLGMLRENCKAGAALRRSLGITAMVRPLLKRIEVVMKMICQRHRETIAWAYEGCHPHVSRDATSSGGVLCGSSSLQHQPQSTTSFARSLHQPVSASLHDRLHLALTPRKVSW